MDMNQHALLMKISECQFVCVELALYLDTHPCDEDANTDYLCYSEKLESLLCKYEELYGPLQNFGHSPTAQGSWVHSKWPWEL